MMRYVLIQFSICTTELVGRVGWLELGLPKRRAPSRYTHPPPSLQLSNPLPNSPGTPTHLGHPHGQLSLSTLLHQSPRVQQPPTPPGPWRKLFKSFRQMQVSALLRNLVHKFRPPAQLLHLLHHSWRRIVAGTRSSQIIHHFLQLQPPPTHSGLAK